MLTACLNGRLGDNSLSALLLKLLIMMGFMGIGSSSCLLENGMGFLSIFLVPIPLFLFAVGTNFVDLQLVAINVVETIAVIAEVCFSVPGLRDVHLVDIILQGSCNWQNFCGPSASPWGVMWLGWWYWLWVWWHLGLVVDTRVDFNPDIHVQPLQNAPNHISCNVNACANANEGNDEECKVHQRGFFGVLLL